MLIGTNLAAKNKRDYFQMLTQPLFTSSKSTMETPEQCVKSVQTNNTDSKTTSLTSLCCIYC